MARRRDDARARIDFDYPRGCWRCWATRISTRVGSFIRVGEQSYEYLQNVKNWDFADAAARAHAGLRFGADPEVASFHPVSLLLLAEDARTRS